MSIRSRKEEEEEEEEKDLQHRIVSRKVFYLCQSRAASTCNVDSWDLPHILRVTSGNGFNPTVIHFRWKELLVQFLCARNGTRLR